MPDKPRPAALRVLAIFSIAACLLCTGSFAQLDEDGPKPKAVLSSASHDFGQVVRAVVVEKTFEIRNEGNATLELFGARTNCPCAVLDFPETVPPGESANLRVEIDTDLVDGVFEALLTLYTNDPERERIELDLKVETRPYVFAYPGYVRYVVPQYRPGDGVVSQRVWAEDPIDFRIDRVESPYPFLTASFRELAVEERAPEHDGPQWMVDTTLAYDAPVGPLTGFLRIFTDHEKQAKVSIPISGFVRPLFAITPPEANIGDVRGEEPIRAPLHFKYFGTDPIEVRGADSDVERLTFEIEPISEGREYWIHVLVPADMPKGAFSGHVTIRTTSELQPEVKAPIFGFVH